MNLFISAINPVNLLVLFTFINLVITKGFFKKDKFLFLILTISLINEILLITAKKVPFNINLVVSIYIILNTFFWLQILKRHLFNPTILRFYSILFLILSFYIVFFEDKLKINKINFVFGSLIYLVFIFSESFQRLKKEDLFFFNSIDFILLTSPILFFFGFSLMFGFIEKEIRSTIIFINIDLYTFVSYYVNILYYSMLNIYIFKFRKSKI